jgi:outer membrane lipoprotein-sorting protein
MSALSPRSTRRLRQDKTRNMPIMKLVRRAAPAASLTIMVLLAACAGAPKPQLTAADTANIDRITAYLNSIPRFEAHFMQSGSFGPNSGVIRLDRPAGDMRIDYSDSDGRIIVIAYGQVQIVDRSSGATTTMPVSRTPLGMLLTPKINLSGAVAVQSLVKEPGMIQITLVKTDQPTQGALTLALADRPLRLISVTVIDTYQRTLTMHLSDIDVAPTLTPSMFQLRWTPSVGQETGSMSFTQ